MSLDLRTHLAGIFFSLSCLCQCLAGSGELAPQIAAIRAIRPEGQGNLGASAAWKSLAMGNSASLLPILEAMDGANDYALNWLRAAIDTIAERELAAKASLPTAQLGQFLLDTRHHPRARRWVFELLARVDPVTGDKLLAGMLNDPSLELRYDAVRKVIEQGRLSLASSNQTGATLLFQQALSSARDVKQIDELAKELDQLGQPIDLLKLFGFISQWKIIGPFDNTGRKGFDTPYPPEQKVDFAAEYDGKTGKVRWQDYVTKHKYGMVDMNQPYGKLKEVTAYAATDFFSAGPQSVELRLGGKNSWKLWLNDQLLFGRDEYHFDSEIDQYVMPAQLRPGKNTLLVKVCQNEQTEDWTVEWQFQLRITDSLGTPIFSVGPQSAGSASVGVDPNPNVR